MQKNQKQLLNRRGSLSNRLRLPSISPNGRTAVGFRPNTTQSAVTYFRIRLF